MYRKWEVGVMGEGQNDYPGLRSIQENVVSTFVGADAEQVQGNIPPLVQYVQDLRWGSVTLRRMCADVCTSVIIILLPLSQVNGKIRFKTGRRIYRGSFQS